MAVSFNQIDSEHRGTTFQAEVSSLLQQYNALFKPTITADKFTTRALFCVKLYKHIDDLPLEEVEKQTLRQKLSDELNVDNVPKLAQHHSTPSVLRNPRRSLTSWVIKYLFNDSNKAFNAWVNDFEDKSTQYAQQFIPLTNKTERPKYVRIGKLRFPVTDPLKDCTKFILTNSEDSDYYSFCPSDEKHTPSSFYTHIIRKNTFGKLIPPNTDNGGWKFHFQAKPEDMNVLFDLVHAMYETRKFSQFKVQAGPDESGVQAFVMYVQTEQELEQFSEFIETLALSITASGIELGKMVDKDRPIGLNFGYCNDRNKFGNYVKSKKRRSYNSYERKDPFSTLSIEHISSLQNDLDNLYEQIVKKPSSVNDKLNLIDINETGPNQRQQEAIMRGFIIRAQKEGKFELKNQLELALGRVNQAEKASHQSKLSQENTI